MSSPTSPKRAKIAPTQGNSPLTAQNEKMALNSSSDEIRIDIISELCKRNIEHAIDIIVENADFQSIVRMRRVSKEWKRIIDSYDNPWQMMLMKRLKDNPDFAAASDLLDWTRYIISSDPKHTERVKYIAYIGTYITEKQRILRRSGNDDNTSSLKPDLSESAMIKEMGGWLFVAQRGEISAWDLTSGVDTEYPQKVFTPPRLDHEDRFISDLIPPEYSADFAHVKIVPTITCFTSNSESEPWKEMKLIAIGCDYDLPVSSLTIGVGQYWIVLDFDTGAVIHQSDNHHLTFDSIALDSNYLVTLGSTPCDDIVKMSIYNTNYELIRDHEGHNCDFIMDDGIIYVITDDEFFMLTRDNGHFTETVLERYIFGTVSQIFGYVALETFETGKSSFALLDIWDFTDPMLILDKEFVKGKMKQSPRLSLLRNGLLLLSDQVMPFPLEDLHGGYRRGIFDVKCDKPEGVHHMSSSEEKTRDSDGEGYIQLMEIKSSPTYVVTRQDAGRGQGSALKIIDLRKVKSKLP